jgi:hypothetical protein
MTKIQDQMDLNIIETNPKYNGLSLAEYRIIKRKEKREAKEARDLKKANKIEKEKQRMISLQENMLYNLMYG